MRSHEIRFSIIDLAYSVDKYIASTLDSLLRPALVDFKFIALLDADGLALSPCLAKKGVGAGA